MASHVIDYISIQDNYGTEEMRQIWSETSRLAHQLEVEKALALAEGDLHVIPPKAAQHIAEKADISYYDIKEVGEANKKAKHSLVGTLRNMQKQIGADGEYVHYGATTQDILDTAMVLQLKETEYILRRDLKAILSELARLAMIYKQTPMSGRTHGVHAIPMTFGFRLSIYLAELGRHLDRLEEMKKRLFTGVLGGAIGTYASYGEEGINIEKKALERLGLAVPEISWHSSRDRLAEFAEWTSLLSASLGKMANDFFVLMGDEVQEIQEPFAEGEIGSSTMPQKRNPVLLENIAGLVKPIFHAADLARDAMTVYHERDGMHWKLEWIAIPEVSLYLSAQLSMTYTLLQGLVVRKDHMLRNLNADGGLIVSEKIMFELGKHTGKQTAHRIIYESAMIAQETGRPFRDVLFHNPAVTAYLSKEDILSLSNPVNYTGQSAAKVETVLEIAQKKHWIDSDIEENR